MATHEEIINIKVNEGQINAVTEKVRELHRLANKTINFSFGKGSNIGDATKMLNSLNRVAKNVESIRELTSKPINLQFGKIANMGETTKFLNALSNVSKRVGEIDKLNGKSLNLNLGNIGNAESAVKTFNSISNLSRNFGKLDMSKLSSGTAVIDKIATKIHQLNQEKIKITIDDNVTTKVLGHLEKIHAEIQTLNSTAKGINFDSITRSSSQFDRLQSELKQTNIELRELKANSNVNIRANYTGSGRNINGTSGNGHKANMFGFNADNSYAYQMGSVVKKDSQRLTRIAEKFNNIGGNLASFVSYAGVNKMTDILIETPARAEVQKYLLGNMQQGATTTNKAGEVASLYQIMDKTTDQLPVSMQNVVNPLYAFNASSQASPQQLADFIPTMANFGAQVINMTGSSERAETAMEKLAYAFRGSFQAVDQYGISAASMAQHGFDETMYGDPTKIEQFAKAIDEITGNAQDSMHNFNGMKQTVSKDFARSGKAVWNSFLGPLATGGLSAFHNADQSLGGLPTMLMSVGAAGLSVATSLTSIIGSAGTAVGAFAELSGSLRATMKNGGGVTGLLKSLSKSSFNELRGNYGYNSPFGVDSPHLSSIDSNVSRIANTQSADRLKKSKQQENPTLDRVKQKTKDRQPLPMSKEYQKVHDDFRSNYHLDRYKDKGKPSLNLDFISDNTKKEFEESRATQKRISALKKKMSTRDEKTWVGSIQNWFTRRKLENEQNKLLSGSSKHMGKFGSGMKALSGLFSLVPFGAGGLLGMGALALGGKMFSDSYQRSQSVRDATARFSTAVGNAGNSLKNALGNVVGKVFYGGSKQGEQALDEGVAEALNRLAGAINTIFGTGGEDDPLKSRNSFPKNMTDAQYYGFEGWESEAEKQSRQKLIDQIDQETSLYAGFAEIINPAFAEQIKTSGAQRKDWLRAGDYKTAGLEGQFIMNMQSFDPALSGMTYDQIRQYYPNYSPMSSEGQSYADLYKYLHGEKAYNQTANEVAKMMENNQDLTTANVTVNGQKVNLDSTLDPSKNMSLDNLTNTTEKQNIQPNLFDQISQWIGGLSQLGNQAIQNPANNNPTQPNQDYSSLQMINSGQMMGQFFQNIDMAGLSQTINTKITEAMNTATSMITPNATTAGTNIMNSIQQGIQGVPVDFSSAFSGITQAMDSLSSEASAKGSTAGNNYNSALSSGLAGASASASAEAHDILAAMDISDEAYQKGYEAGQSYSDGFEAGQHRYSPGTAARSAQAEGKDILSFMNEVIHPAGLMGYHTGKAYADAFNPAVTMSTPNYSVPQINKENTAPHLIGNANNQKNINLTQNINIEKVDSRDRAREIAEETLKIVTWNNETAGRSVEV